MAKTQKSKYPKPPETHQDFVKLYPKLGEAWDLIGEAESGGVGEAEIEKVLFYGK